MAETKAMHRNMGGLSTVGDLCAYQIWADKARRDGPVPRWKRSSLLKAVVLGLYPKMFFLHSYLNGSLQMFFLHSYLKPSYGVQSVSIYLFRINEELTSTHLIIRLCLPR